MLRRYLGVGIGRRVFAEEVSNDGNDDKFMRMTAFPGEHSAVDQPPARERSSLLAHVNDPVSVLLREPVVNSSQRVLGY